MCTSQHVIRKRGMEQMEAGILIYFSDRDLRRNYSDLEKNLSYIKDLPLFFQVHRYLSPSESSDVLWYNTNALGYYHDLRLLVGVSDSSTLALQN